MMAKKPDRFKEIEKRYKSRIARKKLFDDTVNLSADQRPEKGIMKLASSSSSDGWYRLFDEGYIMSASGNPVWYAAKGVVDSIYNNVSSSFTGIVNLAHQDAASSPVIIGTWTKKDLRVVDAGEGRKGLDVKLNLDEDSVYVQDLKRQQEKYGTNIGISSELEVTHDWDLYAEVGTPVVTEARMEAFAVVGEAGNARSGNITLSSKGDNMGLFEKLRASYGGAAQETEPAAEPKTEVKDKATIELSIADYDVVMEQLKIVEEFNEKEEQMLSVMEQMDNRVKELEKENLELKAAAAEGEQKTTEAKDKIRSSEVLLEKLSALTSKLGEENKAKGETGAVHLGVQAQLGKKNVWEELSEDGIGGDL